MRAHAVFAFALVLSAAPASAYNVTISGDPTSNGTLTSSSFKATGPDAVLNYLDLQTALATSDFKVLTTGHGTQTGDITVAHKIVWSANTLTLDAYHSIVVNKRVQPTVTSGLELTTNDGGTGGDIEFGGGKNGSVNFDSTAQSLNINTVPYTLVDSVSLMATDIGGNPSGNYALAHDDTELTVFGSTPVTATFSGNFAGLGNTISGLQIHNHSATSLALFSTLGTLATLKDLTLSGIDVQGGFSTSSVTLAGLVVSNNGLISNVTVSGEVQNTVSTSTANLGGLVGTNQSTGTLLSARSTATVLSQKTSDAGGLVGVNNGVVSMSSATGDVTSAASSATAGGLIGVNQGSSGSVTLSFAKGNVAATGGTLGGLIGSNFAPVSEAFATGDLDSSGGTATDGGFVGSNSSAIADSYARGAIVGQNGSTMGGFVGSTSSTSNIATSYSTGAPAGGTTIGGFAGFNNASATSTSLYWNTTTSGLSNATGNGNDTGITGLTSTQLRSGLPAGFSGSVWTELTGINNGFPYLIDLPPA